MNSEDSTEPTQPAVSNPLLGLMKGGLFGKSAPIPSSSDDNVMETEEALEDKKQIETSNNNGVSKNGGFTQVDVPPPASEAPGVQLSDNDGDHEPANVDETEHVQSEKEADEAAEKEAGDENELELNEDEMKEEEEETPEVDQDHSNETDENEEIADQIQPIVEEPEEDKGLDTSEVSKTTNDAVELKEDDDTNVSNTLDSMDDAVVHAPSEDGNEVLAVGAHVPPAQPDESSEEPEEDNKSEPVEEECVKKIISMDTEKEADSDISNNEEELDNTTSSTDIKEEGESPDAVEITTPISKGAGRNGTPKSARKHKVSEEVNEDEEEEEAETSLPSRRRSSRKTETPSAPTSAKKTRSTPASHKKENKGSEIEDVPMEEEQKDEETPKRTPRGRREHKEEANEEQEEGGPTTRARRSTATPATPAEKATPRGRRSAKTESEDKANAEDAPKSTSRSSRKGVSKEKEEEEEEPQPKRVLRGRAAKIPQTPQQTPKPVKTPRSRKSEASESASTKETETEVESEQSAKSTGGRGRKSSTKANEASAGRRGKRGDGDDPYDMETEFDKHPEPLKNISIEKGAFGDMKYTRTPSGTSKYSKTEQTASERVANLNEEGDDVTSPKTLGSLSKRKSLATPHQTPKTKSPAGRRKKEEPTEDADEEKMDVEDEPKRRGRKRKTNDSTAPNSAKRAAMQVEIPQLDAEAQWAADHPEDDSAHLVPGARVYAMFDKIFYPALVADRDTLGRYIVQFVADGIVRPVPPAGVVPLSAVVVDKECLGTDMDPMRVIRSPNAASAKDWLSGMFTLMNLDGEEQEIQASWATLSLDISQWKDYVNKKSAQATSVSSENIHSVEDRRERRSRATDRISTPETLAKTPRQSASASRVKAANSSEFVAGTPVALESAKGKPDTPSRRGRGRKPAATSPANEEKGEQESGNDDQSAGHSTNSLDGRIFLGKTFILTSANRQSTDSGHSFKKNDMKKAIQERGGVVVDDIALIPLECDAYLISDTHYRTHKYLAAMARAMPCVSHQWIQKCVEQETLLPCKPYLLAGGQALLNGKIYPLPTARGVLLKGKRVMVHSNNDPSSKRSMSFVEIWQPIVRLLGATLIEPSATSEMDILLTDHSVDADLIQAAESCGAAIVSSEWLIQAIIMSDCPAYDAHPRFRYDSGSNPSTHAVPQ